jgi:hypothetical protein
LRARPALGQPAIFINEFGADTTHLVPGWAVAEITALEAANVDEANLSCWGLPPGQGNECFRPDLDGLLTPDGTQPHAVYWVFASYAIMSGQRVPVTASSGAVSGFATRQPSNGAIKVLLGRHVSCTARTNRYCNQRGLAPAPASYVSVTIKVSTTSPVSVAVARVPNVAGALAFPRAGKPNVMDPKSGQITVDLPTVGDGDAYFIDIEPVNSNG